MKTVVVVLALGLASCYYVGAPPKLMPFGFLDGTVRCCEVVSDGAYYTNLRCGPYLFEKVTNFVRLQGECIKNAQEAETNKGTEIL